MANEDIIYKFCEQCGSTGKQKDDEGQERDCPYCKDGLRKWGIIIKE